MISSTMRDLRDERDAARQAIETAGLTVWWAEAPPATFTGSPREFCQKMAEQCTAYLLILGPNYGFTPEGQASDHELSITQMEFLWARGESSRKIRVFIQVGAEMTADVRQRHFIDEVLNFDTGFVRFPPFSTPDELAQQISTALHEWLTDAQLGLDAWLRSVRDRYSLVPNPLIGRTVPITTTVPLRLRTEVDDSLTRHGWQEDEQQGMGALGASRRAQDERRRRREARRASTTLRVQPIILPVQELLDRFEHLIVLGDPGAGKSTLLRQLAHDHAVEALGVTGASSGVPLYVSCTELAAHLLSHPDSSLVDALAECAQADSLGEGMSSRQAGQVRTTISAELEDGHVLLLIDGLDEVDSHERAKVLDVLQAVRHNRVILTMRPSAWRAGALSGWKVCELQPLDTEQRQALLRSLIRAFGEQNEAGLDSEVLQRELNRRVDLRVWAGNPLLLTLLASQYRVSSALPTEVAKLYEFAVEELTDQRRSAALRKLTRMELDQHVRHIALGMMQQNLVTVDRDALDTLATVDNGRADSDLVNEILERAAVLQQQAPGRWGFVHLTFQEYLAAQALVDLPVEQRQEELRRRRLSARWEQTFLLLVSTLDLQGQQGHTEADRIVVDLALADSERVVSLRGRDPTHSSLLRATRCQQARTSPLSGPAMMRLRRFWSPTWRAALSREGMKYGGSDVSQASDRFGLGLESMFGFHIGAATTVGGPNGAITVGYGEGVAFDALGNTAQAKGPSYLISRQAGCVSRLALVGVLISALVCAVILGIPALSPTAQAIHAPIILPILNLGWLVLYSIILIDGSLIERFNLINEYRTRVCGDDETELRTFQPKVANFAINAVQRRQLWARVDTVRALGHLGPTAAEAIPILRNLLQDDSPVMRAEAARALGQIGPAALSTSGELRTYLGKFKSAGLGTEDRAAIAAAIVSIEGQPLSRLLELLQDRSWFVQAEAARVLSRVGSTSAAQPLRDALLRLLGNSESSARISACAIIEDLGLGAATEGTVDTLIRLLHDSDRSVQTSACSALATFGAAAANALPVLLQLTQERDIYGVRSTAIQAIQAIDPGGPSVALISDSMTLLSMSQASLRAILSRSSVLQFMEFFSELKLLPPDRAPTAASALLKLHHDSDWWVRKLVAEGLGEIGPKASNSVEILRRMARDRHSSVRTAALVALVSIGADSAAQNGIAQTLVHALADHDVAVQTRALALLKALPLSSARTIQLRLAQDVRRYQRAWITRILSLAVWPSPRLLGMALLIATQVVVLARNLGLSEAQWVAVFGDRYGPDIAKTITLIQTHANWLSLVAVWCAIILLSSFRSLVRFWLASRRFYKADSAVRALQPLVVAIEDA